MASLFFLGEKALVPCKGELGFFLLGDPHTRTIIAGQAGSRRPVSRRRAVSVHRNRRKRGTPPGIRREETDHE